MRAIVVKPGPRQPRLSWEKVPDPRPGPAEVLLEIHATAVNRADLLQARGRYPPPPGVTEILGLEAAGVVAEVGPAVSGWRPGDRAMALLPGGGYAERAAVPGGLLLPLPEGWSFAQGAAVPEAWITAYLNLCEEAGLKSGETVLIHAGASGVGTAAIQLGAAEGARVFATAGGPEKLAACRGCGAEEAFDYKTQDFAVELKSRTGGRGVDVILDPVGASHLRRNLELLAPRGRIVLIGVMGGSRSEIDLALILGKSLRLIGSRLRPRPLAERVEIVRRFRERILPRFRSGELRPMIDRVLPIPQADSAHDIIRENRNIGKVVLEIPR
ncbi:MAG: NAD(P)H-quinone oxidoreductase [Desulfobacterales bacterium]